MLPHLIYALIWNDFLSETRIHTVSIRILRKFKSRSMTVLAGISPPPHLNQNNRLTCAHKRVCQRRVGNSESSDWLTINRYVLSAFYPNFTYQIFSSSSLFNPLPTPRFCLQTATSTNSNLRINISSNRLKFFSTHPISYKFHLPKKLTPIPFKCTKNAEYSCTEKTQITTFYVTVIRVMVSPEIQEKVKSPKQKSITQCIVHYKGWNRLMEASSIRKTEKKKVTSFPTNSTL